MTGNLGTVAQSHDEIPKAKEILEKSLQTIKQIGSKDGEGSILTNLGVLCCSLGEYWKAREYYEKALAISREANDRKGEMTINNNLGMLYLSQKEFQKALQFFHRGSVYLQSDGRLTWRKHELLQYSIRVCSA